MILVDEPPIASASDVLGSRLENVAGSDAATGLPDSSTKSLRRRFGVEPKTSEWISPRRELFNAEAPGAPERLDRTKSPLELEGISGCRVPLACTEPRPGLELEA